MNFKLARRLSPVFQWGGLAVCVAGAFAGSLWVVLLGTALAGGSLAVNTFFLRCPHCNQPLGAQGLIPEYCPHCGKKLE